MDTTDTTRTAPPREALLQTIQSLLLGPMAPDEILRELPSEAEPTDFYLTGILWPRNEVIAAAEDEKSEKAEDGDADTSDDSGAPLFSILKPSSIGVTCAINGETTPFEVVVRGARYLPQPHSQTGSDQPTESDESGGPKSETYAAWDWERKPFEFRLKVPGDEVRQQWRTHHLVTPAGEPVTDPGLAVYVRRRVRNGTLIVTASFLNMSLREEGQTLGPLCIYQAELEVRAADDQGNGWILPRPSGTGVPDDDVLVGDLLYRRFHEFGVGHGVAAMWPQPIDNRVSQVRTDWLPTQSVTSVSRTGDTALAQLVRREPSPFAAAFLSNADNRVAIVEALNELCQVYEGWIARQAQRTDFLPALKQTAANNLDVCRDTVKRIREGIALIRENDRVFRAFCLANEAMNAQANGRQRGDDATPLVWYPFQLAFILLTIPSIVDPENPARSTMDLLWFPTGGGKTEAYLGLTAFTIFHRRLSGGTQEPHVDVLMRYTLRLLTVQQFQRASALICAAETIRRDGPDDLGDEPISIGLYVGEGATPNKLVAGRVNALQIIEDERQGKKSSSCTPRLLLNCPLCGAGLSPECYNVNRSVPTLEIICPEQTCPSMGKPLPVYVVDEDIYRNRPSLVIGTIDKFAQLPRKEDQGFLFGQPGGMPPELIIQDELHLISGPLGTIAGLYEVCIDLMCSHSGHTPKVIGSTATIGRARQQVKALFDRGVLQFPPSALDADNSFFAVADLNAPDRLYVGISSAGRSPKFTLQAVTAAALAASQQLLAEGFSERAVDPYWTLLLYFNSLRELGGAKIMMQDDVPRSNAFYSGRLGITPRGMEREPEELTSRIPSTRIPETLRDLAFPKDGDPYEGSPIDIVIASNMISVGMDIPRLGFMIVNGQPKSTSEYIQATSRVGRGVPGLIFTVFNAARPRDMSHFEHFVHYHETIYRRVEVTSVTPWSSRARDRALHAIFIAAIRHLVPGLAGRFSAAEFDPDDPLVGQIKDWIVQRAARAGAIHVSPEDIRDELDGIIARWATRARKFRGNTKFEYWATTRPYDNRPVNPHLMRSAEDPVIDAGVWPTPNSMRDVEPSAYYVETVDNSSS